MRRIIIQYVGDDATAVPLPHGNSHTAQPFVRTCLSVLATVRCQVDSAAPNVIYKKVVAAADVEPELQPVAVPRNWKQVQNVVQVSDRDSGCHTMLCTT